MATDPKAQLTALQATKEFFIGIDSDGCAFDTMEIKHKECFCPNFVEKFDCQPISKYTREAWEFVNLYSKWRGCNRWLAVLRVLGLLRDRKEVKRRGVTVTDGKHIQAFADSGKPLSNDGLKTYIEENNSDAEAKAALQHALEWSLAVNATIARMVHDVPPFPFLRESLEKARPKADMIVVSQTPVEALTREWKEHKIDDFVRVIAGQEMGTKGEHIRLAAGGKYPPAKMLMIGDAPGDLKAARQNDALFYPINPGDEESSWQRLNEEALDRFLAGDYAGDYEKSLLDEFEKLLPEQPPWSHI